MSIARSWYEFRSEGETVAEIVLYGPIGGWADEFVGDTESTARAFDDQLKALPDTITNLRVNIHSPGGDVFAAVKIANALREQRTVHGRTVDVYIDGLAASAASIVIMAGDTIRIADNALVMLHDPFGLAVGNADEVEAFAGALRTIKGAIIATYRWRSPKSEDELAAMMTAETWLDADQAIEAGFATEKITGAAPKKTKAAAAAMARLNVPEAYRARVAAFFDAPARPTVSPTAATALDVVKACTAANCLELAEGLISVGATVAEMNEKIGAAKAAKEAEEWRISAITRMCATANLPRLSASYIAGGMPVDAVKAQLLIITALVDASIGEIDNSIAPDADLPRPVPKVRISHSEVFADRARQAQVHA